MSKKPDLNEFNLRSGVMLASDEVCLLAGSLELESENVAHTFVFKWKRGVGWSGRLKNWTAVTLSRVSSKCSEVIVVGAQGECFVWGDLREEDSIIPCASGVRSIRDYSNGCILVGMSGLACKLVDSSWSKVFDETHKNISLESGLLDEGGGVHAVGWRGVIVNYSDSFLKVFESITNVILTDICISKDGYLYCCGQKGVIVRGKRDVWEIVHEGVSDEDFWSIVSMGDSVYVVSARLMYQIKEEEMKLVKYREGMPLLNYSSLDVLDDQFMLSVGRNGASIYNGNLWEPIL